MEKIINYSYNLLPAVLHESNSVVKTETVKYKPLGFFGPEKSISVPIIVKENVSYFNNDVNTKALSENISITSSSVSDPSKSIGTLTLTEKGTTKTYKLYSTVSKTTLAKNNITLYLLTAGTLILILLGSALIIRITNINKSKKRRRKNRRNYRG